LVPQIQQEVFESFSFFTLQELRPSALFPLVVISYKDMVVEEEEKEEEEEEEAAPSLWVHRETLISKWSSALCLAVGGSAPHNPS